MDREIRKFRMKYLIVAEFLKNKKMKPRFFTLKYGSEVEISHG